MRMHAQALRSLAAGSVGAGWSAIGTPFTSQIRILQIWNLTDALLTFSFTGPIDNVEHFVLPAQGFVLFDLTANKSSNDPGFYLADGTQLYAKQNGVPTTGSIYVTALYAAKQK